MVKANKAIVVANEVVMNKLYYLQKQKVMLDRDLAELCRVKTIRSREQVKRNHGIAKCDTIQTAPGRLSTVCFYRTWRADAGECIEE